jgi:uncharacterized C2H2 Zn-finger protein
MLHSKYYIRNVVKNHGWNQKLEKARLPGLNHDSNQGWIRAIN